FAFEVVRDTVAITRLDVPVDTVVRGVELAADVPLRERRVGPVEYVGERLRPGDPIGLLCPEAEPVRIGGLVRRSRDIRITRERLRRIEAAILLEQVGYCFLTHRLSPSQGNDRDHRPAVCEVGDSGERRI